MKRVTNTQRHPYAREGAAVRQRSGRARLRDVGVSSNLRQPERATNFLLQIRCVHCELPINGVNNVLSLCCCVVERAKKCYGHVWD
jgi:hypothetical protein